MLLRHTFILLGILYARIVFAGGDDNYYIYSNAYGGAEPWYTTTNSEAMNTVFGFGGWTQDFFETCDPDVVFSANTNFVFLEGSDGFADELESFLSVNISLIEDWVNSGGRLLLNAAPNEGDGMSFGFGDVLLNYAFYSDAVHAEDPTHPIFNGPYLPVGTDWTGTSFGHATVTGAELTPLITYSYDASQVVLAEGRYGSDGIVCFGGMTTNNFHSPYLEAANLRANIIYYLAYYVIPTHDMATLSVLSPETSCSLGVESVTVKYKNYGLSDETGVSVSYQVDGGAVVTETIPGTVASGEAVEYTFATPADFTAVATHTVDAWVYIATDEDAANDAKSEDVTNVPLVNTFPYAQDFESGDGGWVQGGANSSWELGDPVGYAIIGPPPATPGSLNSWTTNLEGDYNLNEYSYVVSPCFDFSSLVLPFMELDINYDIQMYDDGAKLQYSLDDGATWNDLGGIGTGDNWYNMNSCYAMWPAFYIDNYNGWAGQSFGWLHAEHDLTFLAGEPSVRFRFAFASSSYWNFNDGFAFDNMWIGDPFPNDVGAIGFAEPESGPGLTATEAVTVTIENFGTLEQTGFPVSYQKDGGPVHTEIFTGTVMPGSTATHTFATTEDLSAMGDYAFTAWTALATDEDLTNDTINKTVSHLAPISGTNAYYIYSSLIGGEPWYTVSTDGFMDDVFGVDGWSTAYYETLDPAEIFGTMTCFVYMEGSDAHADELEGFLNANMTTIENWVASGGHLLLNAAPNEGDGMSFGFDGVDLNYPWFSGDVTAVDPGHPVWSGPFTPTTIYMSGSSYGHATVDCPTCDNIIVDAYNPDRFVLTEKNWGAGHVIFGGMTMTDFHYPTLEAANFKRNLLSYLGVCTLSDDDIGVQSVYNPASGCGLEFENVSIKVRNYGFLPQFDVQVNYQIEGGAIVTETVPGLLDVGEVVDYTFATPADLTALGDHELVTWTSLPLDTIYSNDTADVTVVNVPYITSFPYLENFEAGNGGWLSGGSNSSWELGLAAGAVITGAPPATPGSQYSWVTNLDGYYNDNEKSYVMSPCMDFSSLVLPYMEFDLDYDAQMSSDGAKVQYTLDGGASWLDLGNVGEGENWYNSYFIWSMWPTFYVTDYRGWDGSSGGWKHAHYDMTFLAGEPSVRFRFVFSSDGWTAYNDGFAFDNFKIQDPYPNDVGVIDVISPTSAVDLTASEVVSVLVKNYGTLPQSGFDVSYRVDGGTTYTELFTGTVDPGMTAVMTFAATEDFSADGVYAVESWTELLTDEDNTNDTIMKNVVNLTPVTGTNAYYIYSNVYGGWEPWYVTSNSEAMDDVFGVDGWLLDYVETVDVIDVFGENTCFVYLEGSDAQASELKNFLDANGSYVENWVASGGHLLLNSAPNEGSGMSFGFGGVDLNYSWYTSNVTAYDPGHPIFNGPWTPVGTDFTGGSFGHASVSGGDIQPIIIDSFDPSRYVLAEKNWGDGIALFGGMTPPYFHSPMEESNNLLRNVYEYIKLCAPVDLGVTAIVSPEGGCGMGVETITVTVENFGPSSVTSFPIKYQVDGGTIYSATAMVTIVPGGTGTYSFTTTYDFSEPGDYALCVWTNITGDDDPTNDMLCVTLTSLETPYVEFGPNMTVCDAVTLDAGNTGSTYLWNTGATTQTISVTESGTYSVTVTNPTTGCTATDNVTVTVNYTPVASFTYTATGLTVSFTNTSTDGASYSWSFGDGSTSTSSDPAHTYATTGSYTVSITVTNGCGSDTYSLVIDVGNAVQDITLDQAVDVHPNPTSDVANVHMAFDQATEITLTLVNSVGQTVWSAPAESVITKDIVIDMTHFAAGVYTLQITGADATAAKQIVLTK
ncbi:MAG: PKD domain-containing protein [Chitinophagales bacterium]